MNVAVAPALERLVAAPPARRRRLARELLGAGIERAEWTRQLDEIHGRRPEFEARVARAMSRECDATGDRDTAAWFRLMEARAVHRAGSPREAAEGFDRAARELEAAGDVRGAVKARVLRVDALAHAGRVDEALRLAAAVRRTLKGRWAVPWRYALLGNEAGALGMRGDLKAALAAYASTAKAFARMKKPITAAIARGNVAVVMTEAGLAEEAIPRFLEVEQAFLALGQDDKALDARYNHAWALLRSERLGEAVRLLRALIDEFAAHGLVRRQEICRLDLAEALQRAGDTSSAYREATKAAKGLEKVHAYAEGADALLLAARTAPSAHAARRALRRARRAARASGRVALAMRCDVAIEQARRRDGAACSVATLSRVADRARNLGHDDLASEAFLVLADSALDRGHLDRAERHFEDAGKGVEGRPWVRASVEAGRAACLARRGRHDDAIESLRRVAAFLDAVRSGLPGSWLRTTFAIARLDPYVSRVELLLSRGDAHDRREAEALLDALAARRFFERARPPKLRGRVDRLRRRLHALYDRLGRGSGSTRGPDGVELSTAVAEARDLERHVAAAWRDAERSGRGAIAVDTARPVPSRLRSGEAALHVWDQDGRLRALLRRGRDVLSVTDLGPTAEVDLAAQRMRFHADRIRLLGAGVAPRPFFASLEALSARLLGPLADANAATLRLVLGTGVPDLPWEVLPLHGRPACAALRMLRVPCLRARRPAPKGSLETTWLALGDDLPGVRREATTMPDEARRLLGAEATRAALSAILEKPGVVHVSGHGYAAVDAPPLGGVRVHDGWFTATDLPPRVRADLVVLAACRTGAEPSGRVEAWDGLPTAVLAAGARRVVWTSEDLDDHTAAEFAARFHRALAAGSPASHDVEGAFGTAVESLWTDPRTAAGLLALRLSGVLP